MFVDGRPVIEGSDTEDGRIVGDDGRSILIVVGSESVEGRIVRDDGKSVGVKGGNKVAVTLSITDTTADKVVTGEMPDMLGIEVTGIVFTIGSPSGPGSTARLTNLTTVCVPLRGDTTGGLPKPFVNVHKLSE